VILKQFYLQCLAHASYLIGDEASGDAAVVDPQRDIDGYLEFAQAHGLRIAHVILTHLHADFLAGHLELRDATGAVIYLGKAASAEYAFTPLGDGDRVEMGCVRLEALETPGHTPESISILVFDLDVSDSKPKAVLTGDTLFVGDVGRPGLRPSLGWSATALGEMLYDSVQRKLLALPDDSLVYPAHGAGSLCGKALGRETVSTIGEQRRVNYALQPMSKDDFVSLVTADQPDAPPYFTYDAVLNTKERQTLSHALETLSGLSLDDVLAAQRQGAQLLDTRDPELFAAAHLKGSINVGLVGQYATWAGTVLSHDRPIVVIADPGTEEEAVIRLGRIGFDKVQGYLLGGIAGVEQRPDLVASTDRLSPSVAAERLAGDRRPVVIDVRSPAEQAGGSIPDSLSLPLSRLPGHLSDVPTGRPILVYCAGGYRSSIAASLLQQHGHDDVSELAGGFTAWEATRLPVAPAVVVEPPRNIP